MALRSTTQERLLDAAEDLFFIRGIAATPIDAVIARAGVSAATLYRGYPSKDALVVAALHRRHREWLDVWDAAIAAAPSPAGRLLAVFDALDAFRTRPAGVRWCAFLASAAEYPDAASPVRAAVDLDTDTMRDRLTGLAAETGDPHPADLAAQILFVVTGDLAMRLRDPAHTTAIARDVASVLVESRRRGWTAPDPGPTVTA